MTPDLTTIFPNGVVVRERDGRELSRRHDPSLAVEEAAPHIWEPAPHICQPSSPHLTPIVGEVLPSAPFVKGSATSHDAAAQQTPRKLRGDESRIMASLASAGVHGMTCDELEVALSMPHQTTSARLASLSQHGFVTKTADRRPTRTGSMAVVYAATSLERQDAFL
jgi:hypothetical protein